jgi:hypothetical protein
MIFSNEISGPPSPCFGRSMALSEDILKGAGSITQRSKKQDGVKRRPFHSNAVFAKTRQKLFSLQGKSVANSYPA